MVPGAWCVWLRLHGVPGVSGVPGVASGVYRGLSDVSVTVRTRVHASVHNVRVCTYVSTVPD